MSHPNQNDQPNKKLNVDNTSLQHLVDDRAEKIAQRTKADESIRRVNKQILELLEHAGVTDRHQLLSGTIVRIVRRPPTRTISAEALVQLNVAPSVIKAATTETPVAPYIAVDPVKGGRAQQVPDDAPTNHTDEPPVVN